MPGQNQLRHGCNSDGISLLTLTAANANVNGADQNNPHSSGIAVVVDITAISGTGATLVVTLEGKDPVSGKYYTILASAGLIAIGTTVLRVFPNATAAANLTLNSILPKTYRVRATITGTTPLVTATVGASLNV
jgi:hypothetical protein